MISSDMFSLTYVFLEKKIFINRNADMWSEKIPQAI